MPWRRRGTGRHADLRRGRTGGRSARRSRARRAAPAMVAAAPVAPLPPAAPVMQNVAPTPRHEEHSFRVLAVDDSPLMRTFLQNKLQPYGIPPEFASSGEEALFKISKQHFDMIFLDVMLPGMDGYDVCKMIKKNKDNNLMKVVMLTSKDKTFDKIRGTMAGCDSYLTKPVDEMKLRAIIERHTVAGSRHAESHDRTSPHHASRQRPGEPGPAGRARKMADRPSSRSTTSPPTANHRRISAGTAIRTCSSTTSTCAAKDCCGCRSCARGPKFPKIVRVPIEDGAAHAARRDRREGAADAARARPSRARPRRRSSRMPQDVERAGGLQGVPKRTSPTARA